jgi:hypothetical protein
MSVSLLTRRIILIAMCNHIIANLRSTDQRPDTDVVIRIDAMCEKCSLEMDGA